MEDFNAKVGGQTNTSEMATGCFGLASEMKEETLLYCRIGNIKKIQHHEHTISEESREEMDVEKP